MDYDLWQPLQVKKIEHKANKENENIKLNKIRKGKMMNCQ